MQKKWKRETEVSQEISNFVYETTDFSTLTQQQIIEYKTKNMMLHLLAKFTLSIVQLSIINISYISLDSHPYR